MDKRKFFLVTTLIEWVDEVSDGHALYSTLESAKDAMTKEISEAKQNFDIENGTVISDLPYIYEWRNEFGEGFTVGIEEITPL